MPRHIFQIRVRLSGLQIGYPPGAATKSKIGTPIIDMKDSKSQTPLSIATQMGNIEAVKLLIVSGADLAIRDDAGKTALHYAIFNCSQTARDFATQDLERTSDDSARTLLHTAAISGNSQTTLALMSALNKSCYFKTALTAEDNQGKTPLLYAAECGYTEIIKIFLRTAASIELDNEAYQQAANAAAKRGHLDTMKFFISVNGYIRGNRLLQAASSTGQFLVVEYLLHNDPTSLASDPSLGPNPLVLAASKGHNEVVRTLLRYGVCVNIADNPGQTPLHHAVKNGRCHVVRTLIHHHANVNASDMEGNTPLHSAAMAVKSRELVKALLKAGAKRDAVAMLNQTPMHIVAREECYQSVDLLRCPENINTRDWEGKLPLYYAIHKKDLEKVKALRPDLLGSKDRIYSAFKYAVESSALNVLNFLLNLELLNEQDGEKRTIIHMAAKLDSLEPLTVILEAKSKPDVNITNELKRTPLHDAAIAGRVENMRYLIKKRAKVDKADKKKQTPLHMAARYEQLEALAVLLEEKAEINVQDRENKTPLYCAANNGHIDIVKRLLEENADVTLISDHGWSPLHAAADNPEIAEMLIAHKANISLPKEDMWTIFHLAIHWSATAVAKLLLEKGANCNVVNSDGNTALHLAIMKDDADMVHSMLEKGADFKIKTGNGLSCLDLAVKNKSAKVLEILLHGGLWDFEDMAAA